MNSTKEKILLAARTELAILGYQGSSMRSLSKKIGIVSSVLYYHFVDKEALLKEVYLETNKQLGIARSQLIIPDSFEDALKQRINFQFDHAEEITAILKYYIHFRKNFAKNKRGYLPEKTYLHIEEILQLGIAKGLYNFPDLAKESKIIVHAINGFILEYFPSVITKKEQTELVSSIADFILRALRPYKL